MLPLLLACGAPDDPETSVAEAETEWITDITIETSEMVPTAARITFTSTEPAAGWIEVNGIATRATTDATEHSHIIYGAPLSDLTIRARVDVDGTFHESGEFTVTTGQLLPGTPALDVTVDDLSAIAPEDTVLVAHLYSTDGSWTVVCDLSGQVLWAMPQDGRGLGMMPSFDRGRIARNVFQYLKPGLSTIEYLNLMGEELEARPTPGGHHFFDIVEGETLWLRHDARRVDARTVVGDEVMLGGQVIFSTWDDLTHNPDDGTLTLGGDDWTHANWLHHDAERDTLLMSLGHHNAVVELSREGELLQVIGGPDSDYHPEPGYDTPSFPHGAHWSADELVLMNTYQEVSEVRRYRLDGNIMTRTWDFGAEFGWQAHALGEAQPLGDGNLLVSWGSLGVVQVVSPDGAVLWEAHSGLGEFFAQVFLLPSRFSPRP